MAMLCLYYSGFAQKEIPAESKITAVKVYLKGAEIDRSATTQLPAGASDVVLTGLTTHINDKTIQVNGTGDFTILGVVYRLNYLQTRQKQAKQKLLEDSIQLVNAELSENLNTQATMNGMADILDANKTVSGSNTSLSLDLLKSSLDYYQTKMLQIKNEVSDLAVKEKKIRDHISQLQNELNDLNNKNNEPTGEIVVQVVAKQTVQAGFAISYIENNAGWSPEYDVRADNVNSLVQLSYKANVNQNSGEDWSNVKLILSTGNPSVNATGPVLQPWYLQFYMPRVYQKAMVEDKAAPRSDNLGANQANFQAAATTADYTTVVQNQLAVEFDISIPYSIPSDGKKHTVSVQDYTLPAGYEYYAAPKLDPDAFLNANITDWGKLNLLSGNANIFFEGAYVGQSYIDANNTKDTLTFSLGRDKKIVVKREQVKDFTRTQSLGNKIKKTFAYDISIKNTKDIPIVISVEDVLPISQDKDIDVELIDGAGAQPEVDTGKMKWLFNLQPNGDQKIRWSFSVQYPKDKTISGL